MCFLNISKKFYDENSMIKIHPETEQKLTKTTILQCTEGQNWMSVHPTVRPPAPTHIMGSESFEVEFDLLLIDYLFHQRLVKFSTFQWLSFEWIFFQNCRFLENWYTTSKRLWHRCVKVRPRVWCKARREAKHRLFCSAPTQLCNYPDSSFLYTF